MYVGVNNAFWLTNYSVTSLEGNKFVNGIIFGAAELTAGVFAGILISKTNPKVAFQILGLSGIVFNFISQFAIPEGSMLVYITSYIAVLGVGGVYTCIFVIITEVVPTEQVGGAMVLVVTVGATTSLIDPLVVVADKPIPQITIASFMALAILHSYFLPETDDAIHGDDDAE